MVVAIISLVNEENEIRITNDYVTGQGVTAFAKDLAKDERIGATQLEAGYCLVNTFVKSVQF